MNKTLEFIKNNTIATAMMVCAGAGISEITEHFTKNHETISVLSTASQFITGGPIFLYLHWKANKRDYTGKKEFFYDYFKYSIGSLAVGAAYFMGRPFLQEYFLGREIGAAKSSVIADFCALLGYSLLQVPIAKLTGVIRNGRKKNENLEDKLKKRGFLTEV